MRFWRWLIGGEPIRARRERDPDLDLVKHMAENHEYRLQLMEHDLERISGGRLPYKGIERRQTQRH